MHPMSAPPTDPDGPDLYFDHNGSTPVHPEVLAAALPFLASTFGNPSAGHVEGLRARARIDDARARIARTLGAQPDEIVFTSGGTESNNAVLAGALPREGSAHLVVSAIEHKSILAVADDLEGQGHRVTRVAPGPDGAVRVRDVERALGSDTALVSIMASNNETGVVQPVREIAASCRARGVRFHTDLVCTWGKLAIDLGELGCDFASLGGHKVGAPKGVGLLYVRRGSRLRPFVLGCGQQDGRRGGTESVFAAVALARAAEIVSDTRAEHAQRVASLRDGLWREVERRFPFASRNGAGVLLPNTLNVRFAGRLGADVQRELGALGISVTAGAAGAGATPSHVLVAMGLTPDAARESVRITLGTTTTRASIEALLEALTLVFSRPAATAASAERRTECRA